MHPSISPCTPPPFHTSHGIVMEIDTVGTFTMCKSAFPQLSKSASPCVINISATLQYGATWYQVGRGPRDDAALARACLEHVFCQGARWVCSAVMGHGAGLPTSATQHTDPAVSTQLSSIAPQVHASAAKAAVDSITRSLALEWGQFGIRVNGIAPGPIEGTAGERRVRACHYLGMHQGKERVNWPPMDSQSTQAAQVMGGLIFRFPKSWVPIYSSSVCMED